MIKKLYKSIREYKKASILSIVFIVLEVLMEVAIPYIMAILLDDGINVGNMSVISKCGFILIGLAIISLVSGTLSGVFASIASCGFGKNLRHDMYYKIQDYSFKNIDDFSTSSLITRLTTDVSNVQNAYQMLIRITFRAPLMLIFSLFMAFKINSKISIIFLCLVPILGFVLYIVGNKAHPLFKSVFETYDELNNSVQENVRGIRVVKSFVKEDYEEKKFKDVSKLIYDKFVRAEKLVSYFNPIMQFSMYSCIILLSWFGTKLIVGGTLTTGELTSLISYGSTILSSLMMVSMVYVMLTMAITSAKRIVEILDEIPTIKNPRNPVMEVKNGDIEFDNVCFSYSKKSGKQVLNGINLKINSGEIIGIIGSTGSSKSSFVNLISRLYDANSGCVKVGGVDVRDYDLNVLRNNVSVVLQKNVLFSGTIIENLKWGNKDANMDDIIGACKIAQADEFVQAFPDKYETYIEQGGTNVSGGQRQRLCIARSLLKDPKVLILDDSTSAVDTKTDSKIREGFKKYIPNVTTIIIAQRVNSIIDADKVIVLDDGKVDAYDTPQNLLKNNDIFRDVYYSQMKGEER